MAIVIPEAEDGRIAAGTIVEVVYPGQFTVIPAPTEPGTHRICGGMKDALCSAAFEITS